jgi:hypothetical protein
MQGLVGRPGSYVSFAHDIEVAHVAGVPGAVRAGLRGGDRGGKVAHEHLDGGHAALLVQVGLLDAAGPPVTGAEQAENLWICERGR